MSAILSLHRYDQFIARCSPSERAALQSELDAIFFQASNTKSFESETVRAAFRERWLGRYLTHDPRWAYLARTEQGALAGYLVGSVEDPAQAPRFSDIAYFARFAPLTAKYPAHLHVNLSEAQRNGGIGSLLVQRFCADAAAAGSPGVHVVTSRGARNVRFYVRNGFHEAGHDGIGEKQVVFLAKSL